MNDQVVAACRQLGFETSQNLAHLPLQTIPNNRTARFPGDGDSEPDESKFIFQQENIQEAAAPSATEAIGPLKIRPSAKPALIPTDRFAHDPGSEG